MRDEKSSRLRVSSAEVKVRSTPFWVATCSVTEDSVVSCVDSVRPERTIYWFGRRILSESPILAPFLAKLSSYCRSIEPTKFSFWWRIRSASRVTEVGVRIVFAMVKNPSEGGPAPHGAGPG